jgi:hypothetical protein
VLRRIGYGRKWLCPNFMYNTDICLERLIRTSVRITGPIFEPGDSRIRSRSANHSTVTFGGHPQYLDNEYDTTCSVAEMNLFLVLSYVIKQKFHTRSTMLEAAVSLIKQAFDLRMVSLHYSTHLACRLACCLCCVQHFFILCRQIQCLFLKVRDCMRREPTSYGVWRFHVNLVFFLRATFQELRKGQDYQAVPMRWYCEHNTAYSCSHTLHIFQHTARQLYMLKCWTYRCSIVAVIRHTLEIIEFW